MELTSETRSGDIPGASHFWLSHVVLPLAAVAVLLWAVEATRLDWTLSNLFFDPATREFPLRRDWFLEVVMHHWARYLVVTLAVGALGAFLLSWLLSALAPLRRELLFVFLAMALATGTVSGLKSVFEKHCPWDLQAYGGFAPYTSVFEPAPAGVRPGQCFPAGHASAGFSLMALYFPLRRRPRVARAVLAGGFALGMALGLGRVAQGAHFLSHNLWSAILCWLMIVGVRRLMFRPASGSPG